MFHTIWVRRTVILCAWWFASPGLSAEAPQSRDETAEKVAAPAQIESWIKQLNSDRFNERNEAAKRLEEAGQAAFPALAEAALGESREVTLRALDILRKHFEQGDQATKDAAKQALQKIAASPHESAAQRAKQILQPPAPAAMPGVQLFPGIQIVPQQIQIQINAVGGGQTRQVRVQNGVKQIEVDENGRKVVITDDPNNGLKIEVTETKDGKEVKQKYAAKNADELKKNSPEGYQVYEKYAKEPGAIQLRFQPGGAGFGGGPPALGPVLEKAQTHGAATMLRHAKTMVENAAKQLERLQQSSDNKEELAKSQKRLADIAKQLDEESAKWENP
jgi:hypothetical protein